jgi:hypothetical protein
VLERSLTYVHTGNRKVISKASMYKTYLSQGIFDQGMPVIQQGLLTKDQNVYWIDAKLWPTTKPHGYPAMVLWGAQVFCYSKEIAAVSSVIILYLYMPSACIV